MKRRDDVISAIYFKWMRWEASGDKGNDWCSLRFGYVVCVCVGGSLSFHMCLKFSIMKSWRKSNALLNALMNRQSCQKIRAIFWEKKQTRRRGGERGRSASVLWAERTLLTWALGVQWGAGQRGLGQSNKESVFRDISIKPGLSHRYALSKRRAKETVALGRVLGVKNIPTPYIPGLQFVRWVWDSNGNFLCGPETAYCTWQPSTGENPKQN